MRESDLVKMAKSGDKEAFCRLYSLYKDRLYRYAYYRLGNYDDAQDAVFTIMDESKTELAQALDILSSDEKEIVLLSVVGGFTSKEISKITGLTAGSVRSKLSRSLAKMRNYLE